MARCSSCEKFCGIEQAEPEIDLSIEGSSVSGNLELELTSECCGDTVKTATVEVDFEIEHDCKKSDDPEFELSDEQAEADDRYEGRPGAPARYRRHFYGANVTATATCDGCDETIELAGWFGEQASSFEDY